MLGREMSTPWGGRSSTDVAGRSSPAVTTALYPRLKIQGRISLAAVSGQARRRTGSRDDPRGSVADSERERPPEHERRFDDLAAALVPRRRHHPAPGRGLRVRRGGGAPAHL